MLDRKLKELLGPAGVVVAVVIAMLTLAITASSASAATPNFCPGGSGAGQCNGAGSIAVDQSTGDLYVGESNNHRVSMFDSAGHFLRAFGFGVSDGEAELETCVTTCIEGREFFLTPRSLAVDGSTGPSAGDLYVFNDAGADVAIEKYELNPVTEQFKLLESFGEIGPGPGQFTPGEHPIALDSSGDLWLGDGDRLEEFSEAGVFLSELPLPAPGRTTSLAIAPSGDFYVLNLLNEIQRIVPPASGSYTLTNREQTSGPLSAEPGSEATAAEVESAMQSITANETKVEGPTGGPFDVEFVGSAAGQVVEMITSSAGSTTVVQKGGSTHGVEELGPAGELLAIIDASGDPNAVALDPGSGDVFVSDQFEPAQIENDGKATLLEFDPLGAQMAAFGFHEVLGRPEGPSITYGSASQRLYTVSHNAASEGGGAQAFPVPPPGPFPLAGATKATAVGKTSATLCAEVSPEGHETTVHFEYLTEAEFKQDGEQFGAGTVAVPEPGAAIGLDFLPHEFCQPTSPLLPATAYRIRIKAANSEAPAGIAGESVEFSTLPPAAVESVGASAVTADSATFEAEINPLGDATTYRFEYLTETAYRANESAGEPLFAAAMQAPLQPSGIGAGPDPVTVSQHLQGLMSATVYLYRVVTSNAVSEANGGPFASPALAFTTQSQATLGLPDQRAWEQVSPVDKHGADIGAISEKDVIEASPSGGAFTYLTTAPTEAGALGNPNLSQVLSTRGGAAWSSVNLNAPHESPLGAQTGREYHFFSQDLSKSLLQPVGQFVPSLSSQATEQTPFVRTDFPEVQPGISCTTSCYRPVLTAAPGIADVPPGVEFGEENGCIRELVHSCGAIVRGTTPDLAHLVLSSNAPLIQGGTGNTLYEWSAAADPGEQLRLISILPDGTLASASSSPPVSLGGGSPVVPRDAISLDGSRVIWSAGGHLYLRLNATQAPTASGECSAAESLRACTIALDTVEGGPGGGEPADAHFQDASANGSRIFFTDSQQLTPNAGPVGDLYEYDLERSEGHRLTDLTPEVAGEGAQVLGLIPGTSEDGEYVYFVANGVLGNAGSGATPGDCRLHASEGEGRCNLYVYTGGTTTFIATLAGADYPSWSGNNSGLGKLTSRVSPSGRWLAFMSQRSLTGYENRDAVSRMPDEEVFLYHASALGGEGKLICASCNPSGARPRGVEYESLARRAAGGSVWASSAWLAANIPGWTPYDLQTAVYQSRYLSDSGRLFFNSSDALVPADSNGAEDVYQYEPPTNAEDAPPADTCTTSSPTYSAASSGCVDLISSGASAEESAFLDASESGEDVFFLTSAQLAKTDTDTSYDVYDARVEGGFPEPVKPVECSGDACQQPAVAPNDATPGSLTYNGPGNVLECPKGKVPKKGKCVKKQQKKKQHKKGKSKTSNKKTAKKQKRASAKGGGHK